MYKASKTIDNCEPSQKICMYKARQLIADFVLDKKQLCSQLKHLLGKFKP